MPAIFLLGLVFVIGLFVFYLFSTSNTTKGADREDDLKKEENVIFLPNDIEREKEKHKKRK